MKWPAGQSRVRETWTPESYIYTVIFIFHAFDFILRTKKETNGFTRKSMAPTEGGGGACPRGPAPFPSLPPSLTVSEVKGRTSCEMNPTRLPERHFLFGCGLARTCVLKTAAQSVPHFIQLCRNNANNNNINNWNKGFFQKMRSCLQARWDTPSPLTGGSPAHLPAALCWLFVVQNAGWPPSTL